MTDSLLHAPGLPNTTVNPDLADAGVAGVPVGFELTPIVQSSAQYGLFTEITNAIATGDADAGVNADGQFYASCGAGGGTTIGAIFSRLAAPYRPGQGFLAGVTAVFEDVPGVVSSQRAGLLNATDSLTIGRDDNVDVIRYSHHGQQEIQSLLFSAGASGSEDIQVEIDSIFYPVNLSAGTARDAAAQTAAQLTGAVPFWAFQQIGDEVICRAIIGNAIAGTFSYVPDGTAAAAFTSIATGALPLLVSYPRESWTGASAVTWLDLTKENVYRIRMQYLGVVYFDVQDPTTGAFVVAHIIDYPNSNTRPMFAQPSMRIGWSATSTDSTQVVTIKGGEYDLFVPGVVRNLTAPKSFSASTAALQTVTYTHLLTIKNREIFGPKVNLATVVLKELAAKTDSTKGATLLLVSNAVFDTDLSFDYINETSSVVIVSDDAATYLSGDVLDTIDISPDFATKDKDLSGFLINVLPGDSISLVMHRETGGSGTNGSASLVWGEVI